MKTNLGYKATEAFSNLKTFQKYISNFLEIRNEDSFGNDRGNDEASAALARH